MERVLWRPGEAPSLMTPRPWGPRPRWTVISATAIWVFPMEMEMFTLAIFRMTKSGNSTLRRWPRVGPLTSGMGQARPFTCRNQGVGAPASKRGMSRDLGLNPGPGFFITGKLFEDVELH